MARPPKEGMDYFPHDTDAVNDEKIEALRALYGNDGYAFYFILLERIYRASNFELDISDAETKQILSRKIAVTEQKFEQMLSTALKQGCFDREIYESRRVLTSEGIQKRAQVVVEKRLEMQLRYKNRKGISAAETREETTEETPQSKVKKSKVNSSSRCSKATTEDAIDFFGKNIHLMPTPFEIQDLRDWTEKVTPDVIIEAIKEAVLNDAKRLKYIDKVLINWHSAGVTDAEKLAAHRQEQERRKEDKRGQPPSTPRTNQSQTTKPIIDVGKFEYQG